MTMEGVPNEEYHGTEVAKALLDGAPLHAAVLRDRELIVEYAVEPAAGLLRGAKLGEPARHLVTARLGRHWAARLDRVRRSGQAAHALAVIDGTRWEISIERLDARRIAVYSRPLRAAASVLELIEEAKETLHGLKNPIYGISVATDILLTREVEEKTQVLEAVSEAAAHAQRCLDKLSEVMVQIELRARGEDV